MPKAIELSVSRRDQILNAAIRTFGRFGFRKTSVEDLAAAAGLSKQGLYLHFSGKDEIFVAAILKYLDDGLALAEHELSKVDVPIFERLVAAMDAWFGRHLATFNADSFDLIEASNRLSFDRIENYKTAFRAKLAKAMANSKEFARTENVCSPKEVAQVLFQFGLTWKDGYPPRGEFRKRIALCVRATCQVGAAKKDQ